MSGGIGNQAMQVIVEEEVVTILAAGEQGPPGPGLASTDQLAEGTVNKFDRYYELAFTNQSSVTVQHNLGKKPAVTVIDSAGDECTGAVNHQGVNRLILTFSASFSGTVVCS